MRAKDPKNTPLPEKPAFDGIRKDDSRNMLPYTLNGTETGETVFSIEVLIELKKVVDPILERIRTTTSEKDRTRPGRGKRR